MNMNEVMLKLQSAKEEGEQDKLVQVNPEPKVAEPVHSKPASASASRGEARYVAAHVVSDDRKTAVRFTNDPKGRLKALKRSKWTVHAQIEVEEALSKQELVELMAEHEDFQDDICQEVIQNFLN